MSERTLEFSPLGWQILWVVGITLAVTGITDLGLGLYPFQFGVPEWEFGSVTNLLNRLPLLGIGLTLVLAVALARGRLVATFGWSSFLLLLAVVVFVFGVLYATNLPIVLASLPPGAARAVLQKAIAKTAGQAVIYFLGLFMVAVYGVRTAVRMRPR